MRSNGVRFAGWIFVGGSLALLLSLVLVTGRSPHYWTPKAMALTAKEATDQVLVLVDGVPIHERADLGDVRVRLNHRGRLVRERLAAVCFGLGVGVGLLAASVSKRRRAAETRDRE